MSSSSPGAIPSRGPLGEHLPRSECRLRYDSSQHPPTGGSTGGTCPPFIRCTGKNARSLIPRRFCTANKKCVEMVLFPPSFLPGYQESLDDKVLQFHHPGFHLGTRGADQGKEKSYHILWVHTTAHHMPMLRRPAQREALLSAPRAECSLLCLQERARSPRHHEGP